MPCRKLRGLHADKMRTGPNPRVRKTQSIQPRLRRGFTLIEFVMVILIIGFIAAMAAPRWAAATQRYQLDLAAQRVAADLAMVKSRTNLISAPITVFFDTGSATYRIAGVPDPDHLGSLIYIVTLSASPYRATIVSAAFGNSPQITYDGYGMPKQTGSVVIAIGNGRRTITIDANGRTTIQ